MSLDPNYYQAHGEYKNFLLTESPFHRKNDNDKIKKNGNHSEPGNSNGNNKGGITSNSLHEHAYRCIRYSLSLLWQKKPKDAKDILQMAFKCENDNSIAKLVSDPFTNEELEFNRFNSNNNSVNDQDLINELNDLNEILKKKDDMLNNIESNMENYGKKLKNILKSNPNQKIIIEDMLNHMNDDLKRLKQSIKLNMYNNNFEPGSKNLNNNNNNNGAFSYLNHGRSTPGSVDSWSSSHSHYNNNNRRELKQRYQKGKSYSHMHVPNSAPPNNSNNMKRKRHSIVSASSAHEYNQSKFMDMHKMTLLNASQILEDIYNTNKLSKREINEKLVDVRQTIVGTVRALDFMESNNNNFNNVGGYIKRNGNINIPNHNRGLTAKMIEEHNDIPSPSINSNIDDENNDYTKTLGAVSMVSQTSSAVMDQRRNFLSNAARNPNVRKADQAVARHIADTWLKVASDTPRSILSQTNLFPDGNSDFDDEDEYDNNNNNNGASNNNSKHYNGNKRGTTSKEQRVVDRVKRWLQNPTISKEMNNIFNWDYDVFTVCSIAGEHAMPAMFYTIAQKRGLIESLNLNISSFCNFFLKISSEYKNNPYHNYIHGCDVLVNSNYFMKSKMFEGINNVDQLACLCAAACHDVGHPGNNNAFEINMETNIAITYNDFSVLENFHASLAWRCLKKNGCNIIESLDKPQRQQFRKLFISSILATDMAKHAEQQNLLANLIDTVTNAGVEINDNIDDDLYDDNDDEKENKPKISLNNIPPNHIYSDKTKLALVLIPLCVHTADLSNPSKPYNLYREWASKVMTEFWNQGDKERKNGLNVTPIFDRKVTDLPTCQTGFINHVIRPWFNLWAKLLFDKDQGPTFTANVASNLETMQALLAKNKEQEEQERLRKEQLEQRKNKINNINSNNSNNDNNNNNNNKRSINNNNNNDDGNDSSDDDSSDDDNLVDVNYNKHNNNNRSNKIRRAHSSKSVQIDKNKKHLNDINKKARAMSTMIGNVNINEEIAPTVRAITNNGKNLTPLALSRFKTVPVNGTENNDEYTIVGMKIEDITKISMLNRLQRIQELKSRTQQQNMMEYNNTNDDDEPNNVDENVPFAPPNSKNPGGYDDEDENKEYHDNNIIYSHNINENNLNNNNNNNNLNPNHHHVKSHSKSKKQKRIKKTYLSSSNNHDNGHDSSNNNNNKSKKIRKSKNKIMPTLPEENNDKTSVSL